MDNDPLYDEVADIQQQDMTTGISQTTTPKSPQHADVETETTEYKILSQETSRNTHIYATLKIKH